MKNMPKVITILCLVMLAGAIVFCRKQAEEVAVPQTEPVPRELVLISKGPFSDHYIDTIDVTWWEEGKDAVIIRGDHTIIPYPWHGEDTIIYAYDGDYLWVRTRPEDTAVYLYFEESGYQCYQSDKRGLGDTAFSLPRWDEDYHAVWLKGSLDDTSFVYFPHSSWTQGRVAGLKTRRYYRMDVENPEDIICIGDYNIVELDSLEAYPNLETIGMSYDLGCNLGFWNYVYHIMFRRNLRKIPKHLDLYVDYSCGYPGLCNCKSRVLSRRKNLAGLVCYIPPLVTKVLRHIGKMQNLRQLDIRYYCANDRKLKHLARLENLHTLTLTGIKISDQGLAHLAKIRSLRSLRLEEFQAHTVEDFRFWSENLTIFWWSSGQYSERFDYVRFIEEFPYQYGSLSTPPTTAEGWKYLAELPYLQELDLVGRYSCIPEITDDDLCGIGQITSLRRLRVDGEDITDEGLGYLCNLKNLEYLYVYAEGSTEEGYRRLKQALPNCEIDWGNRLYYNSSGLH